jgi:hypothetical protein
MVKYLDKKIVEVKETDVPRYGIAADGYTLASGAPLPQMIRLEGEKTWRRLMLWQFSNAGTCFVKIKGEAYVVRDVPGLEVW